MLRHAFPVLLLLGAVLTAGCDSSSDGLVLDGTYSGSGQTQISNGAAPATMDVTVSLTFDEAVPGDVSATVAMTTTTAGAPTESFTGSASGTLSAAGALSLTGSASGSSGGLKVILDGTATASQIQGGLDGSVSLSGLVLTR